MFSLSLVVLVAACGSAARAETGKLTLRVAAGKVDRVDSLATVELPSSWAKSEQVLLRTSAGEPVPAQLLPGQMPRLVWRLSAPLAAGETRTLQLTGAKNAAHEKRPGVSVKADEKQIIVQRGDQPVLVYNAAIVASPGVNQEQFDRGSFIHPVYSPAGQVVTDSMSPDHRHQHGIMFPWRKTTFAGRAINFWEVQRGEGRVEHAGLESTASGPVFGQFVVRRSHVDRSVAGRPQPVLRETWTVTVYAYDDVRLFDLESVQTCAGRTPLTIEEYHYGGLGIRGRRNWHKSPRAGIVNSAGQDRNEGNLKPARWVDIYGPADDQQAGMAVLCHPSNFRAPQPARLHPSMPYFCYAPEATGAFTIEPGTPYRSRYRFVTHAGPPRPELLDRLYRDYAEPVHAEIVQ